ncbi:MAG TPA: MipA/OmpV family protein [Cellvibrio sp.]|nr:MipA/OmpV family protein [Cellvibrio sp.]
MIIAKSRFYLKFLLISCFTLFNSGAQAADSDSQWQLSLGLGAGIRTNPVMDNDDIPLVVIPQVSYQGEHFFIQNLDFGYTLLQDEKQQLNLLITPSYDQVFFNKWDINNFIERSGLALDSSKDNPTVEATNRAIDKRLLHKRRMGGLAGLEYSHSLGGLDIQLQLLTEVTQYYNGTEARVAVSKAINLGKHDVKLTLGTNWQDEKTHNYFYGLPTQEALNHAPYNAAAGFTSLLRFDWSYQLDEHWSLRFFTSYRHLSSSISDSPLVTSNNVITAFAGGVYHF